MPWNNSPLEENPTAESGIEPGTSRSPDKGVNDYTSGWSKNEVSFVNISKIIAYLYFPLPLLFSIFL